MTDEHQDDAQLRHPAIGSDMSKSSTKLRRSSRASGGVQSVEVGINVLKSLAELGGEESLGKIAEHVSMPPAKVHRYLASLIRAGFVDRSANSNRYMLGGEALRIGLAALSRLDVVEIAHTELDELRNAIEGSLLLAVWGSNGPTIVRWLETARPVTVNVRVGSNMPLLRSATGQVFAALMPASTVQPLIKAELDELKKQPGRAPTLPEIEDSLGKVRKRGFGHTGGGVLPGVAAIAAPIYDHTNQLTAVICALGPVGHFDDSFKGPTAQALLATSKRLSERLGSTHFKRSSQVKKSS